MNVLIPAILAVLMPLGGMVAAMRISPYYVRHVGVIASMMALSLSGLATLTRDAGEVTTTLGPLMLHFDQVAASLTVPMTLAMGAIMLAIPRGQVSRRLVIHAMGLLAMGMLGVLADNAAMLLCTEIGSALWCANIIREGKQGKALRIVMGVTVLSLLGAMLVLADLSMLTQPFSELRLSSSRELYVAASLLSLASLVRLGVFPASMWMAGCFDHRRGAAILLTMIPLAGVTPILYLIEPMLEAIHAQLLHTLVPAVLCASLMGVLLSLVQTHLGRAFAFLLSSVLALIMAGALDVNPMGAIGAEVLWASTLIGATGFGLATVVSMARMESANLNDMGGLSSRAPGLGLFFLILGAAMVGIPGTTSFVGAELILNGSVSHGVWPLIMMVAVMCLQGLSVMRLFFGIFYGPTPLLADVPLQLMHRERVAFFGMTALLVIGGLLPGLIPLMS